MVQTFRTKIVEIEAVRWTGDNEKELYDWTNAQFALNPMAVDDFGDPTEITAHIYDELHETWIGVKTCQWIVKGAKGEFYPCDDETFHWKYEEVINGEVLYPECPYDCGQCHDDEE